jgi:hypothetical protein
MRQPQGALHRLEPKPDLISDIFFSPAPPFTCHTYHAKPHYAVQGHVEIR